MIKVWGRATSSNVQALMWCIGELGLPYERVDIGHKYGGNDTPDFLRMNPNGAVPVLQDGDAAPIWETGAICRYLANTYGNADFWPADPSARAQVDQWAEWAKINVTLRFTMPVFWRVVRTAPSQHDKPAIAAALSDLHKVLAIAERQLGESAYLASSNLTLADIHLGHLLYRYFDIDIERAALPNLRRYYDHLSKRPAFQDHVMLPYEELRVSD